MFRNIIAAAAVAVGLAGSASAEVLRAVTASSLTPFTREATDELPGFAVEYVRALAAEAGYEIEIEYLPWKRAQAVVADEPGMLLFGATRNAAREPKYDWVTNLITVDRVFLTTGAAVNSIEEARGLGAIAARSVYYAALEREGFENLEEGETTANFKKLKAGRVDAVFTITQRAVFNWTNELGFARGDLTVGQAVGASDIWLAASRGYDAEVMRKLDAANAKLRSDGTYAALYAKYFGDLPILDAAHPEKPATAPAG